MPRAKVQSSRRRKRIEYEMESNLELPLMSISGRRVAGF
jgi:hypothetical protein